MPYPSVVINDHLLCDRRTVAGQHSILPGGHIEAEKDSTGPGISVDQAPLLVHHDSLDVVMLVNHTEELVLPGFGVEVEDLSAGCIRPVVGVVQRGHRSPDEPIII